MLDTTLHHVRKLIPSPLFTAAQPVYHCALALLAALVYRFPSRRIKVIAVTGTKGKTSVTEIVNAILEEAGYKTALSNTIRFKAGSDSEPNHYKMSMPGRFFVQRFLRHAVDTGCDYVVMEVTSQGALMKRHAWIDFDALIFTNLAPEHIEAHGSYENYVKAKLGIADAVAASKKKTVLVANTDDAESPKFLEKSFDDKRTYCAQDAEPLNIFNEGFAFTFRGSLVRSPLTGAFNLMNVLAAMAFGETQNISVETMKKAVERFGHIPGRVERIDEGQGFAVIVDYAHTPDSLQKLYAAFHGTRRICVLGNTGGGRDAWKRDEMAKIAESECDEVILTNEDPYDDDPEAIVAVMAEAFSSKIPHVIMDRRQAIAKALSLARAGDSVLITGKGTDPYIMGPNNTKTPWSDAAVTREELEKLKQEQVDNAIDLS